MKRKLFNLIHTQKGLALVSVLAMVTLATVIVLALFSVSDTEFKASKIYAGGNSARQLADTAVNVVIGQIRSATVQATSPSTARVWSSQPGAVRVYRTNGTFWQGYKLYSDSDMVVADVSGDQLMSTDAPDVSWNTLPDRYVDLNEPVVRAGADNVTRTYFPIVDPRAAADSGVIKKVEGFSYSSRIPSGGNLNGVVETGNLDSMRLPMPVEWMYVLKDGSLGTMGNGNRWQGTGSAPSADNPIMGRVAFWTDDETSKVNVNTASEPGYWCVPTFFHERDKGWVDSPPAMNEYQRFPGHPATVALSTVLYPSGNSATPKYLDTYTNLADLQIKESIYNVVPKVAAGGSRDGTAVFKKDEVDDLTVEGRVMHSGTASTVAIVPADGKSERLYASLDEFIFSQNMSGSKRQENDFSVTGINASVLERTRFFMTAHSRAPELNIFGRPRVAMWPIPDVTLGTKYRTGYDGAIAAVATLGATGSANTYYFTRRNADSSLEDIGADAGGAQGLLRNQKLMNNYLDKLMQNAFPGGSSFATKYGAGIQDAVESDYRQILVEIFDYIRSTNLYDSFLAPKLSLDENAAASVSQETDAGGMDYRWEPSPPNKRGDGVGGAETEPGKGEDKFKLDERLTAMRADELNKNRGGTGSTYYTYTEPRFKVTKFGWEGTNREVDLENEVVASGAYPGHGQVTPSQWQIDGQKYKGFGRFPTISEVGLHFICTADGLNDEGSYRLKSAGAFSAANPNKRGISGGRTAEKISFTEENKRVMFTDNDRNTGFTTKQYWYSNFPPEPSKETITTIYGCEFKKPPYLRGDDTNPANHPGCDPRNWNATLQLGGKPLEKNQKRVQVAVLLEFFVPSLGYTRYAPEWTLVLTGLDGIKVKDVITGKKESVFSTTENQVLKSNLYFGGSKNGYSRITGGSYPLGGATSPQATTIGRRVKGVGSMPEDPGYDNTATNDIHVGLNNYPLVGSFVTVDRTENIQFYVEKPLVAKLYSTHDWQKYKDIPVQEIEMEFPASGEAPPPELVRYSVERRREETYVQETVDACRWWAFNYGGALHRWTDTGSRFSENGVQWKYDLVDKAANTDDNRRTRGRFFDRGDRGSIDIKYDPELLTALGAAAGNVRVPVSTLIYGYAPAGGYNGTRSRPQDRIRADMDYYKSNGLTAPGTYKYFGTDSVRSILPKYGDYRIVAGRSRVSGKMWKPHELYSSDSFFAHNFTSWHSESEAGFYRGGNNDTARDLTVRLVPNTTYKDRVIPDTPQTRESSDASYRYGDFDNGPGDARDGAYINKPDEGNLSAIRLWYPQNNTDGAVRYMRNAYLHDQWLQLPARESFFTPNRMISSPGMFGSLPTGVYGSQPKDSDANVHGQSWRTLLFRPYTSSGGSGSSTGIHPGAPAYVGGVSPADHYIMDLFWMPVVGPYAISDSWSTAGKINMNFQIVPFTYINRSTAMFAAMKGELITAVPKDDTNITGVTQRSGGTATKSYKEPKDSSKWPILYFSEADGKHWHRRIDLQSTTKLMKARMDADSDVPVESQGLFRSASQICEVHLIPQNVSGASVNPGVVTPSSATAVMSTFWQAHAVTGDNVRERPYTNLYQKLTTRSNTFRVFYRAQSLRKARSLDPAEVRTVSTGGSSTDTVVAEYRGSALIERYLDMTASGIPDYAGTSAGPMGLSSLENFYRYRVLESKQFTP